MRIGQHISRGAIAGSIATLATVVCSLGIATAATGDSLTLGHHNSATKTTTLTDKRGTPLALIGKHSKPPLTVNSSILVKHLNAALLGGLTAGQISTGSAAPHGIDLSTLSSTSMALKLPPPDTSGSAPKYFSVLATKTAPLAAGTYYAIGTALGSTSQGAICFLGTSAPTFPSGARQYSVIGTGNILDEATVVDQFTVKKGQRIGEWCANVDTNASPPSSYLESYNLTAIRISTSHAGTPTAPNFVPARGVATHP